MNIHEFQAKQLLQQAGFQVPEFEVVKSLEEVEKVLEKQGWTSAVIKAQIHAGGRGKAGAVKLAHSREEILQISGELLGKKIVNQQTGREGMIAYQLLLSPLVEIKHEYYLSLTIDRQRAKSMIIISPVGGMDIEQVAHSSPEQVLTFPIATDKKLHAYQILQLNKLMKWTGELAKKGPQLIQRLIQLFDDIDATLLEINPLIQDHAGDLIILDAKIVIDENALFRQPVLKSFFDPTQVPEQEARAQQYELAYVALEGTIGCMVNGAGLAMATMDLIQYYGGKPANFLDVGGGASVEKVAEGFKIILSDPKVKAILVNIFGGIMNCETLAAGIIAAVEENALIVPLVVRMEGTNVEQGKALLKQSKLNIIIADHLADAAKTIVQLVT